MDFMPACNGHGIRWILSVLICTSAAGVAQTGPAVSPCDNDTRCLAIRNFFQRHRSPLVPVAYRFLTAADENHLDWRLLPALSMVETTAGRYGRKTNVFGWNSGRARFKSVEAGIDFVAKRLSTSPSYAGRTARGILQKYNPARSAYVNKVTRRMMEISPEPVE